MDRPESAVSMTTRIGDLKESIFSGTNRVYLASGIAIIALVAGGTVLNAVLSNSGPPTTPADQETLISGPGSIDDPLREVAATGGEGAPQGESGEENANLIEMGAPPTPPQTQPTFVDSRVPGENYLLLAGNLSRAEASDAAQFLTENGVPAIPIGIESGTVEGNNHERFLLYSLFGVPGQQFSAMLQQRTDHQERIRTLGGIWIQRAWRDREFPRPPVDEIPALTGESNGRHHTRASRPKGQTAMSLDRSLKTKGKLTQKRSVMTRAERIEKLQADKKHNPDKDGALGLPKTLAPKT